MSEWITDRLPTKKDGQDDYGWLWVTIDGQVVHRQWSDIKEGQPWKFSWDKPAPYVEPKRWTVEWGGDNADFFTLYDSGEFRYYLPELTSDQADAARRICDIYNEVVP
jgi:hypothetical protein